MRHCSLKNCLWCEGSLAFEQAHKAFSHPGVCCDIRKVKMFNATKVCLHVFHYRELYRSSLCCNKKRQDPFFFRGGGGQKLGIGCAKHLSLQHVNK